MRSYKPFLVVLAVTTLLWLLLSMSDVKEFGACYQVRYEGYDTNRYALLTSTDTIQLTVSSTGFQTLGRNYRMRGKRLGISIEGLVLQGDTAEQTELAIPLTRFTSDIRRQLGLHPDSKISFQTDGLNLTLAQRRRKAYVPRLRDVGFEFAEGFSLGGEPRMNPDTVYLYGSQQSLDAVDELFTRPTAITRVDTSRYHTILLDTSWRQYPDLHISDQQVQVFVPVATATEQRFTLPVRFLSSDTTLQARLYPEQVEVSVWIPTRDYGRVKADQFEATVAYEAGTASPELHVRMDRFPSNVQIRSVTPNTVKYVIIK